MVIVFYASLSSVPLKTTLFAQRTHFRFRLSELFYIIHYPIQTSLFTFLLAILTVNFFVDPFLPSQLHVIIHDDT